MKLKDFVRDDNGKPSISRVLIFLLAINYIALSWYFALSKIQFDIPLGVGALISILYGVNKASKKEDAVCEEVK